MSKKVQNSKSKKQFKLGDEIIEGTDTLLGAIGKKFNISNNQAQAIMPLVSKWSNYTPGEMPRAPFNAPVADVNEFVDPDGYKYPGSAYAIVDPVQRANNIYARHGGFAGVMKDKQLNPNFSTYESDAKTYYNNAGQVSDIDRKDPYGKIVKPYNNFMGNNKKSFNVPILSVKSEFGGYYDPNSDVIGITPVQKVDVPMWQGADKPHPTGVIGHELTHRVQQKVAGDSKYGKKADIGNGNDNLSSKYYLSEPREVHARATMLNQEYADRTGKVFANENELDNYVSSFVNNIDKFEDMQSGYRDLLEKSNVKPTRERVGALMEQRDDYRKMFGSIPYRELGFMYGMLSESDDDWSKLVRDKNGEIDKAKAAKYLKALLMTTAKNNEQIPQQPNGVFNNGFNIS